MTREELLNSAEYWQEMAENDYWREGIKCNINLIDKNKQWHKVDDELPPEQYEGSLLSREVLITDGKSVYVGYYLYDTKTWYNNTTMRSPVTFITHWAEIPQLPE